MRGDEIRDGDLLFVADQSAMSQAIQEATGDYSHVGIVFGGLVYHATVERGVVADFLADFLAADVRISVFAYPEMEVVKTLQAAKIHLGKPYNPSFYPSTEAFYCSEYIAEILPIFERISMQFGKSPNEISPFWQTYYEDLGLEVPLGQPGTNPSQLAQSNYLVYKGEII